MGIVRIDQLPEGDNNLSNDDIFIFMDNPGASGITRKISLSELSNAIGGGGGFTVVELTFASTINTDTSAGDIFDITLTGSAILANPTNPINGKTIRWRITQDNGGNRGVTLGNKFNAPSSASSPLPWSTTPNSMDILAATYHSGRDAWDIVAFVPGY